MKWFRAWIRKLIQQEVNSVLGSKEYLDKVEASTQRNKRVKQVNENEMYLNGLRNPNGK